MNEQIEYPRQELGRDPNARVGYYDDGLIAFAAQLQTDLAPRIGILGRVGEHVGDALYQPRVVAIDVQRLEAGADKQNVLLFPQQRLHAFAGLRDDRGKLLRRAPQLDAPLRDPRDVEQVVHQPRQMGHLTLHQVHRFFHLRIVGKFSCEDLARVADRCERIAQLVREHRQELVFAPVGLLQYQRAALGLGCVMRDAQHGLDAAAVSQLGNEQRVVVTRAPVAGVAEGQPAALTVRERRA